MEYDRDRVDEAVLALLYLNFHDAPPLTRAWKSLPWESLDRLYERGQITDPKTSAKSVIMTEQGKEAAEMLFLSLFGK